MIFKICPHCKIEKNESQFYKRRNDKNLGSYCKDCTKLQVTTRQQKLKQEAVEYKGGKCLSCNYDKYQGALEFHHLNPNEKEFNISQIKSFSLADIKEELDKCILLCSNCHKEIHANLIKYDEKTNTILHGVNLNKQKWEPTVNLIKNTLDIQEIELRLKNKETLQNIANELSVTTAYLSSLLTKESIYVSRMPEQQEILHPKKIEWPSVEDMQKLVWEKSALVLAKELGVSDVSIGKFCKKHNINKPPRGYWAKQNAPSYLTIEA